MPKQQLIKSSKKNKIPIRNSELKSGSEKMRKTLKNTYVKQAFQHTLPQLYNSKVSIAALAKKSSKVPKLAIVAQMIAYYMHHAYNTEIPRCFGEEIRPIYISEKINKNAKTEEAELEEWILNMNQ